MLFNSYIFIFLFLPLTWCGYFIWNHYGKYQMGKLWLTLMSLWFYAYFNKSYLLIIISSIFVNYCIYCGMQKFVRKDYRRILLGFGILFNVGLIFYYKYFDFFIENTNEIFGSEFSLYHILLPLGISFFTFQQISFLVDAYRGECEGYSILDYSLFVTFFPQLIAGPIVTHNEMIPQFQDSSRKIINRTFLEKGCFLFILGLTKKIILADTFGRSVDWGFQNIAILDSTNGILVMLFYTMQIYFDFSGYCDMARGIGYFFGIEIPVNFKAI